jgi:hypothetical protein
MKRQIGVFTTITLIGSILCGSFNLPVAAQQDALTRAEVYRLQNNVQLLLRNQTPRPARLADVLVPLDALRTSASSIAELLFNEGSIARVDQNTTFRFEVGLRRFRLPNLVALNETTFVLENGTALIISPPASVGTQIRTPQSQINIAASEFPAATLPSLGITPALVALHWLDRDATLQTAEKTNFAKIVQTQMSPSDRVYPGNILPLGQGEPDPLFYAQTDELLPPPERSSAVMVVHDAANGITQVFALTDGDITVANLSGTDEVSLLGGQTVAVAGGQLSDIQEFDLAAFYRTVPLAAGLGPGQESVVDQQPDAMQNSLNAVRPATLAAVRRQERRLEGFTSTFLRDALSGSDSDFDGQRGRSTIIIDARQTLNGVFIRRNDTPDGFNADFVDENGNVIPISVNTDNRTISVSGSAGSASNAGLSGNNASGTIVFQDGTTIPLGSLGNVTFRDGQAIRIEVFNVNGDFDNIPAQGGRRPGQLTIGLPPDR